MALVFTIDDTSPTIAYSPFADTFSTPNLTAGWNPYFNTSGFAAFQGQTGNGTSLHITSLEGAGLAVRWFGTGIQLYGNTTNEANYSITVDLMPMPVDNTTSNPTGGLLFSLLGLPQDNHSLSLNVIIDTPADQPTNSSMFVLDNALIQISPENGTQPTSQPLPDNNIDFRGNWSLQADINTRVSTQQGDTARIQFLGQAFFLNGTTSPNSGNYSVTIDNSTPLNYSAKSSFTAHDTLLFYATGLQENMTHEAVVSNAGGGELGVANGGWWVFADGSPTPTPAPSASPSSPSILGTASSPSFPKGTIAAFALAGILAFLLLSGLLFFFLIYRPRKKHKQMMKMRASERFSNAWDGEGGMKEREVLSPPQGAPSAAAGVLDIRPQRLEEEIPDTAPPAQYRQRDSGKSGFTRWRREMQDLRLGNGIKFRHSDSVGVGSHTGFFGADVQREGTTASSKSKSSSSKFSISSSFRVHKALTAKGKRRAMSGQSQAASTSRRYSQKDRSRSPSYALDFPLKETSPVDKDKVGEVQESEDDTHESGIATLSYISTPSPKPAMYTLAGFAGALRSKASKKKLAGNASPPSGPRTVSESTASAGATHGHDAGRTGRSQDERGAYSPVSPSATRQTMQLKPMRRRDRGSVLPEEEEHESERSPVLGPATARAALRGLSPRTSRAIPGQRGEERPQTAEAVYPPQLEGFRIPQHAYAQQPEPIHVRRPQSNTILQSTAQQHNKKPRGPRGLPVPHIQTTNFETAPRHHADAPITAQQPTSKVTSPDEVVEVNNGVFLSVRELSPFRIDFPDQPSRPVSGVIGETRRTSGIISRPQSGMASVPPSTRVSGLSHVRFDPSTADVGEARRMSGGNLLASISAGATSAPEFVQGSSKAFRLTPLTTLQPPTDTSSTPPQSSAGVTSFLDLAGSSDASLHTRSVYGTTDSAERERAWEMLKAEAREKSRWSMTTGLGMVATNREQQEPEPERNAREEGGSNASQASSTFPIPFQVSIPPSPYPPGTRPERYSRSSYGRHNLHVHPAMDNLEDPASPTESIPFSVSDLNFRHGDTESQDTGEASDSQFPSHPPLPGSDTSTPLSTPNFIVQRVLGMTPPTAVSSPSRPAHSQSGSHSYFNSPLQPLRGEYHTDSSRSNLGRDTSR